MPEIPELVVMVEALRALVADREIAQARPIRAGILKTVEPDLSTLAGQSFSAFDRRGKHLILSVRDDLHLVIHLMRAGRLVLCKSNTKVTKASGFVVTFRDGEDLRLIENGHVKRAKVHLVFDPREIGRASCRERV